VLFKPLVNLSSPLVLGAPRATSGWKALNRK
jgi:hypothetical protein